MHISKAMLNGSTRIYYYTCIDAWNWAVAILKFIHLVQSKPKYNTAIQSVARRSPVVFCRYLLAVDLWDCLYTTIHWHICVHAHWQIISVVYLALFTSSGLLLPSAISLPYFRATTVRRPPALLFVGVSLYCPLVQVAFLRCCRCCCYCIVCCCRSVSSLAYPSPERLLVSCWCCCHRCWCWLLLYCQHRRRLRLAAVAAAV